MPKFLLLEIFPKLGFSFARIRGSVGFEFDNRKCFLVTNDNTIDLELSSGSISRQVFYGYHPLMLYVEAKNDKESLSVATERICDILSIGTEDHIAYFSARLNEYLYSSGYQTANSPPCIIPTGSLNNDGTNSTFLDGKTLMEIIKKIESSQYKNRLFASAHLNRLAKYKSFSHVTEAITDCINAIEAIYMIEMNGHNDVLDNQIVPEKKKTPALKSFLENNYPGNRADLNVLENDFYGFRSAYLHRGQLLEAASGDISTYTQDQQSMQTFQIFNIFYKIAYLSILNFIKTH